MVQGELSGIRVEVEELAVPSPIDGDPQLLTGLVLGEASPQQVEEEGLTQIAVLGRFQCLTDGLNQRSALARPWGKDLLGLVTGLRPGVKLTVID
jgi:hypothetical protein